MRTKKLERKQKNINEEIKRDSAITLIALVITIIVLLILAGVTIAILTGENGILKQAENAKKASAQAEENEKKELQKLAESIEEAPQVTDKTPGVLEGEGTENNPYKIQSIEDLVVFAYEVTNGRTFLKEDGTEEYVELSQSLDFESEKSYIEPYREDYGEYGYEGKLKNVLNESGFHQIGTAINAESLPKDTIFSGVFEGNGYIVYNLKIQQEIDLDSEVYINIGMFARNLGVIQNLGIERGEVDVKIGSLKFLSTGLLAGVNYGEIKNCYSTGEVMCKRSKFSCNAGGLVGSNYGRISECYNQANVTSDMSNGTAEKQIRIGGVVGVNEDGKILENSYNTGNITGLNTESSNATNFVGGMAGLNFGEINTGYNIGMITVNGTDKYVIGSVIGKNDSNIANTYYLENTVFSPNESKTITTEGEEKTSEEMKQKQFTEMLNLGNSQSKWIIRSNQNQGYPILNWQF